MSVLALSTQEHNVSRDSVFPGQQCSQTVNVFNQSSSLIKQQSLVYCTAALFCPVKVFSAYYEVDHVTDVQKSIAWQPWLYCFRLTAG